jgi:DNA-binding response OmpR family regulator
VGQTEIQPTDPNLPTIDRSVMCVVYRGQSCFLGNTLMLKFLERLARRPNRYVSYDSLLSDVWNSIRENSSVRSVVKELRAKLRAAGMSRLSDAIDGHVSGHYGLMLDRTK